MWVVLCVCVCVCVCVCFVAVWGFFGGVGEFVLFLSFGPTQ